MPNPPASAAELSSTPPPWFGGMVPWWLKSAWLVFLVAWVPAYWIGYGPTNFLWFCDTANFILLVALVWESPLILSAQAAGVLILQLLWCVDYFGALLFGVHPIGGTEYMFDASLPLGLRALSFFHLAVPILLFWSLRRFGYDRKGWRLEWPILALLVVAGLLCGPELNVNWSYRPFGVETGVPLAIWAPLAVLLYPTIILGVTHNLLVRLAPLRPAAAGDAASA